MNKTKTLLLGALAASVCATGAYAHGLLGEQYMGVSGGYGRLDLPGLDRIGGWSAQTEINAPIPGSYVADLGVDANFEAAYARFSGRGVTAESFWLEAQARAYGDGPFGLTPYVGSGLAWAWTRERAGGTAARDDGFGIPLEGGVEYVIGNFSVTPYARYVWAIDRDQADIWEVGARSAFWFNGWGLTATVFQTDLGRNREVFGVTGGIAWVY